MTGICNSSCSYWHTRLAYKQLQECYATVYRKHMQQWAYATMREHSSTEQSRQKHLYDQSLSGSQYDVGDEVWLHYPAVPKGLCKKLHRPWQGPFTIVNVMDHWVYRIQCNDTPRQRLVVHYNRLKPYHHPFKTDVYGRTTMCMDRWPSNWRSEVPEQREMPLESSPKPPLWRSQRMRRPPDRYGQGISYPDCYISNSDSDSELWCCDARTLLNSKGEWCNE